MRYRLPLFLLALTFAFSLLTINADGQTTICCTMGSGGGTGTVTSVGITAPAELTATGSPVTTSGTIALTWAEALQNRIFAGPSGANGTPTFRVLVAGDIPSLDPSKITGTAVVDADARLTDARTPTAHASTHEDGGADEIALAQSQVADLTTDLAAKVPTSRTITAGAGLSGTGDLSADRTFDLEDTAVTPGSYTNASITVDQQGRLTLASSGSSSGANTALSNLASVAINAPLTTGAGTVLALSSTAPAAVAASQTGPAIDITTPNAVAGTSTAGAAAGPAVNITTGNAARLTSGNARGADLNIALGAGIGTGLHGVQRMTGPSTTAGTEVFIDFNGLGLGNYFSNITTGGWDGTGAGTYSITGLFGNAGAKIKNAAGVEWAAPANNILAGGDAAIYKTSTSNLEVGLSIGTFDSAGGITAGSLISKGSSGGTETYTCATPELLTLSTGGVTTTTAANLVTANMTIDVIKYRVTTSITTATAFTVNPTSIGAFVTSGTATAAQTGLTAGTTGILRPAAYGDTSSSAANTLTVTTTGVPDAGAIRLTVCGVRHVAPSS